MQRLRRTWSPRITTGQCLRTALEGQGVALAQQGNDCSSQSNLYETLLLSCSTKLQLDALFTTDLDTTRGRQNQNTKQSGVRRIIAYRYCMAEHLMIHSHLVCWWWEPPVNLHKQPAHASDEPFSTHQTVELYALSNLK